MSADLIIKNIKTLYTPFLKPPVKGKDHQNILVVDQAFVAIKDKKIIGFGTGDFKSFQGTHTQIHDAHQMICLPGFVDSHTHLVHAGSREDEFIKLREGIPYLDILKNGGGILGTVEKTRHASFKQLYDQALASLDEMLMHGVTTLEAKSGYGLNFDTEVKQLKVAKALNEMHPVEIVSTYMGAHATPKAYQDDIDSYVHQVCEDIIKISSMDLAESVDVFCEKGVFSIEQSRKILKTAKDVGFNIKIHADEIYPLGGTLLGVSLNASSVDHLMAIRDEDIEPLACSNTVANLLPGTSFYLNKPYAKARQLLDSGCAISLSSDYNPGSCPSENFQFVMQLAANHLKMKPEEILTAVTINAAYHLNRAQEVGSIEVGKRANLIFLNAPNLNYILYHFAINHVKDVMIDGVFVVKNKNIVRRLNETN